MYKSLKMMSGTLPKSSQNREMVSKTTPRGAKVDQKGPKKSRPGGTKLDLLVLNGLRESHMDPDA